MFLLFYIRKDKLISSYFLFRPVTAIPSIWKFGNNDIELTKVLKGLIHCFGNVPHYLKEKHYKNQIIVLTNTKPGTWLDQICVDKAPSE